MGQHVIRMPDIGEGIAEVELVEWRVAVGDVVTEDQVLVDVMTDKATVEIPSPVAGTVMSLGGKAGEVLAVQAELIRLEVEGEGNAKAVAAAAPAAAAPLVTAAAHVAQKAAGPAASPTPAPKKAASSKPPTAVAPARAPDEKPIASPAVRRRAWDLGIELRFVHGSGPAGRVMHEDLDAYAATRGQPTGQNSSGTSYAERNNEDEIPVVGLRRKIAMKMQEAKRRIPHFSYVEEIDVTELEALRARLNAKFAAERGKLTLLPFIARAVVLSVRDFPQMNARYDDDNSVVTRYGAVHLGVAAQTDAGLMVPVLRHAEAKDVWGMAAEIARLAEAARTNKATRDELMGSTITISSLGPLGGIVTTPVINLPEVAIIGVNRVVERPVMMKGAVVARLMMNLSSSFDHRVVDGMDAAQFIQAVRGLLESPAMFWVE